MVRPEGEAVEDWHVVDQALRGISSQRSALDAEEARWLREAERLAIWRPLGMVSALDYMERVLGYTPHAAHERLRVARALGELPALTESFERGELGFSAIRELTRVATPQTEVEWRDACISKTVRQIEDAVAGRFPGDRPSDPAQPDLRSRTVRFDLRPDTIARLRQTRTELADEHGGHLDDDQLFNAFCDAVLENSATDREPTGRAKFQIALTVCERCGQGWQHGGGARIAVDAAAVERARCDAQHLGSIDAKTPARAHQDIPPGVVRFVWHRDGGRCQTPGCRSARGLEIHHIVRRTDGGSHEPANLTLRCSACHQAHHAGTLTITGSAPDLLVTTRQPQNPEQLPDRERSRDPALMRTQTQRMLTRLGWKPAIARAAVEAATSHVGPNPTPEAMIREALRNCPRPGTTTPHGGDG
jgi:hypothetical protein